MEQGEGWCILDVHIVDKFSHERLYASDMNSGVAIIGS